MDDRNSEKCQGIVLSAYEESSSKFWILLWICTKYNVYICNNVILYYEYKIGLKVVQIYFSLHRQKEIVSSNSSKLIKIYYNDSFVTFNKVISINIYISWLKYKLTLSINNIL